jgi:hypothetical protein
MVLTRATQRNITGDAILYIFTAYPLSSLHKLLHFSNIFNKFKETPSTCALNRPCTANLASSVLENFLSLMCFLRLQKTVAVLMDQIKRLVLGCVPRVGSVVSGPVSVASSFQYFHYPKSRPITLFICTWGWSGTKSTVTAAIYWPNLPALDERW